MAPLRREGALVIKEALNAQSLAELDLPALRTVAELRGIPDYKLAKMTKVELYHSLCKMYGFKIPLALEDVPSEKPVARRRAATPYPSFDEDSQPSQAVPPAVDSPLPPSSRQLSIAPNQLEPSPPRARNAGRNTRTRRPSGSPTQHRRDQLNDPKPEDSDHEDDEPATDESLEHIVELLRRYREHNLMLKAIGKERLGKVTKLRGDILGVKEVLQAQKVKRERLENFITYFRCRDDTWPLEAVFPDISHFLQSLYGESYEVDAIDASNDPLLQQLMNAFYSKEAKRLDGRLSPGNHRPTSKTLRRNDAASSSSSSSDSDGNDGEEYEVRSILQNRGTAPEPGPYDSDGMACALYLAYSPIFEAYLSENPGLQYVEDDNSAETAVDAYLSDVASYNVWCFEYAVKAPEFTDAKQSAVDQAKAFLAAHPFTKALCQRLVKVRKGYEELTQFSRMFMGAARRDGPVTTNPSAGPVSHQVRTRTAPSDPRRLPAPARAGPTDPRRLQPPARAVPVDPRRHLGLAPAAPSDPRRAQPHVFTALADPRRHPGPAPAAPSDARRAQPRVFTAPTDPRRHPGPAPAAPSDPRTHVFTAPADPRAAVTPTDPRKLKRTASQASLGRSNVAGPSFPSNVPDSIRVHKHRKVALSAADAARQQTEAERHDDGSEKATFINWQGAGAPYTPTGTTPPDQFSGFPDSEALEEDADGSEVADTDYGDDPKLKRLALLEYEVFGGEDSPLSSPARAAPVSHEETSRQQRQVALDYEVFGGSSPLDSSPPRGFPQGWMAPKPVDPSVRASLQKRAASIESNQRSPPAVAGPSTPPRRPAPVGRTLSWSLSPVPYQNFLPTPSRSGYIPVFNNPLDTPQVYGEIPRYVPINFSLLRNEEVSPTPTGPPPPTIIRRLQLAAGGSPNALLLASDQFFRHAHIDAFFPPVYRRGDHTAPDLPYRDGSVSSDVSQEEDEEEEPPVVHSDDDFDDMYADEQPATPEAPHTGGGQVDPEGDGGALGSPSVKEEDYSDPLAPGQPFSVRPDTPVAEARRQREVFYVRPDTPVRQGQRELPEFYVRRDTPDDEAERNRARDREEQRSLAQLAAATANLPPCTPPAAAREDLRMTPYDSPSPDAAGMYPLYAQSPRSPGPAVEASFSPLSRPLEVDPAAGPSSSFLLGRPSAAAPVDQLARGLQRQREVQRLVRMQREEARRHVHDLEMQWIRNRERNWEHIQELQRQRYLELERQRQEAGSPADKADDGQPSPGYAPSRDVQEQAPCTDDRQDSPTYVPCTFRPWSRDTSWDSPPSQRQEAGSPADRADDRQDSPMYAPTPEAQEQAPCTPPPFRPWYRGTRWDSPLQPPPPPPPPVVAQPVVAVADVVAAPAAPDVVVPVAAPAVVVPAVAPAVVVPAAAPAAVPAPIPAVLPTVSHLASPPGSPVRRVLRPRKKRA